MRKFLEAVERHDGMRSGAPHPDGKYENRIDWVFLLYTAAGWVDGINCNIDRHAFFGTRSQRRKWLNGELRRQLGHLGAIAFLSVLT